MTTDLRRASLIFWLCILSFAVSLTAANAVEGHPVGVGWGLLATGSSALLAWRSRAKDTDGGPA